MATADYIKAGQIIRAPDIINAFNEKADTGHSHDYTTRISDGNVIIAWQSSPNATTNLSSQFNSLYGGTWGRSDRLRTFTIPAPGVTINGGSGSSSNLLTIIDAESSYVLHSIPARVTVTIMIGCDGNNGINDGLTLNATLSSNKRGNLQTRIFTSTSISFQGVTVEEGEIFTITVNSHTIPSNQLSSYYFSWSWSTYSIPSKTINEYIYAKL